MKILKTCKIIFFIILCSILSYNVSAFSIKLDTTRIYKDGNPGDIIEGVINVINSEENSLPLEIEIEDLAVDTKKQTTVFKPYGTLKNSCSRWINLNPPKITLQPKTSQALHYIITIPQDGLKYAEYFSVIFVSSTPSNVDMTKSVVLASKAQMGILVKIKISSLAKPEGKIESFSVTPLKEDEPLKMTYKFNNSGNVLQKIFGTFSIIDKEGNLFGRGNMKRGLANPGDVVNITSSWDGDLDAGTYDLIAEFKYEPDISEIKEISFDSQYEE